jgi:short-subunit dehydrogenase
VPSRARAFRTYAATKAFDRVFAEGLWTELSPYGIDVTTVMPGRGQYVGISRFSASRPRPYSIDATR